MALTARAADYAVSELKKMNLLAPPNSPKGRIKKGIESL
jgi:hypothetical protein